MALRALYHMNNNYQDSSGNGNDGIPTGATFDAGGIFPKQNQAGSLDGDDDVNVASIINDVGSDTEGTIFTSFKTGGAGLQTLFSFTDGDAVSGNDVQVVLQMSAGVVGFAIGGYVDQLNMRTPLTYNDNNKHQVVIAIGSTGNKFYIDGSAIAPVYAVGNATTQKWFNNITNPSHAYLGRRVLGAIPSFFYSGLLDEFGIESDVWTAQDVSDYWNDGNGAEIGLKTKRPRISKVVKQSNPFAVVNTSDNIGKVIKRKATSTKIV